MSDNPFQAPESDLDPSRDRRVTGVLSGKRSDLRSVALYQRGIMICILVYFGCIVGSFLAPSNELKLVVGIALLFDFLVAMIFVFLLSIKVYGVGLGIVFGFGSLVPCINLIVLLVINSKATSILKDNGIKVGFLGANPSDV
jgi:hypothetical protein